MFVTGIRPQDWTQSRRNAAVLQKERERSGDMKLGERETVRYKEKDRRRTEKDWKIVE